LRPALDTRAALGDRVKTQFPAVAEACLRNGLDPTRQPIPVAAAAHFHMGGIDVDAGGRASLGNLWVCGEASSTGFHGANRLASNGLLEALVYARACAAGIDQALGPDMPQAVTVSPAFQADGSAPDPDAVATLRRVMTAHVGVVRNAAGLKTALAEFARLEAAQAVCPAFLNMTATATLIAAAALMREESRGAHCRDDFPEPREKFARRSRLTLDDALALRAQVEKELS
ncbi:MAG: FAD-binding protein, partial [Paracoccaceae bacterium]